MNYVPITGQEAQKQKPLQPFHKISLVILLTFYHTVPVLMMLVRRICIRSTNNPQSDIFLYSHHLSA